MEQVDVVLTGNVISEDVDEAVQKMAVFANISKEKARRLITSGKITTIKQSVTEKVAEQYQQKLLDIGVEVLLQPSSVPIQKQYKEEDVVANSRLTQQDTGSERKENIQQSFQQPNFTPPLRRKESAITSEASFVNEAVDTNPYQAPRSEIDFESESKHESNGEWSREVQKLPASRGWSWIRESISIFQKHPWRWMMIFLVFFLFFGLVSIIPIAGNILQLLLTPIFYAGIMLTADAQLRGEPVRVKNLFSGFGASNKLWGVGVVYCLGIALLLVPFLLFFGVGLLTNLDNPALVEDFLGEHFLGLTLFFLIASCFAIPLLAGYMLSPALIVFGREGVFASYKSVITGVIKNWLAFLVNGVLIMAMYTLVAVCIGGGVILIVTSLSNDISVLAIVLTVVMIPLGCIFVLSTGAVVSIMNYACCRDLFYKG